MPAAFISARIAGSDASVDRLEAGCEGREHAPRCSAMTGPNVTGPASVRVVQRAQAVGRDAVDPADELVDVAAQARGREQHEPDDDPDGDDRRQPSQSAGRATAVRGRPAPSTQTRPVTQ